VTIATTGCLPSDQNGDLVTPFTIIYHHITSFFYDGEIPMAGRNKIEERIIKKEQEIQELEMKIREARAYVQALQDVAKLLPREQEVEKTADAVLRPGGSLYDARAAILKAGKPLHIADLLRAMGREVDRKGRIGLASSLAAYVRRNEIFTRPKPNTFGLIESQSTPKSEAKKMGMPPKDFALDNEEENSST
jgi:hypothetical protein